jgi:hypothetical protein
MKVAGWLRRRFAFASPFAIVIACWRSSEPVEPVEPAAAHEHAPVAAIAPSNAMPEAPITAGARSVTAVPIDAAQLADAAAPGITNPLPTHRKPPTANPPSTTANPSGEIIARVIAVSVTGNAVVVTVTAGTNLGVAKDWHCQLIDQDDRPAHNDGCMIVRVDMRITVLKVKLTTDQIRGYLRARLTPPP